MTAHWPALRRSAARWLVALASVPAAIGAQDTLHLGDLQRAALASDPRWGQAQLLRDQSALRLANIRAERLPSLGVNAQAQHQSDVTSVRFPGAQLPFKDTYDANVGLRLRLLDPSRTPRVAVEDAQRTESEARIGTAVFGQRQAVNDAFFAVKAIDAQRQVLLTAITDLEAQLRIGRDRVAAGAALPSDTSLVVAELIRRRQSIAELDANRAAGLTLLSDLSGRAVNPAAQLGEMDLAATVREARRSIDSLKARPEYQLYAATRGVTRAREDALNAQDKPRLSAFTRTGYGRPGLNMLARDFDTYWLAGVQVEWAPFDWGVSRRERETIALQRDILATEERAFADRIRRATIADLATIDRLDATLADDERVIALRDRILQETRLRHAEGVVTVAELVDRDTDLQAARLTLVTHRVELEQARARFLTTLGLDLR